MRILVVTCSPWRDDNNIGNSYSNLFSGMEDIEFASLFLKEGQPQNNIVKKYFQITEKNLIANLLNSAIPSGKELVIDEKLDGITKKGVGIYNKLRIMRWQLFFWVREYIWRIGRWNSPELIEFIDSFNPDIIFAPLQDTIYLNRILIFIKKYTNKPLITYAWDDVYTLKQFSLSPLFWINRFMQRTKIRKVVKLCEYLYVISENQKKEYEMLLKKECKILYKGYDFSIENHPKSDKNKPLKLLYTGNISSGRWKSLALIANSLKEINRKDTMAQLYIYTLSPINKKAREKLNDNKNVFLMGGVSSKEVYALQNEADILVHVEPFDLKGMLVSRLSFSTKLVDYFYMSKCIFAVGKQTSASIDYLIRNDAALVATEEVVIKDNLKRLIENPMVITEYSRKAWNCGKCNHQRKDIKKALYEDLKSLVEEE